MKTDRKLRSSMRKAPLMASLTLACALMTGNAGAGIPVTDVGNMPNHIITQISSYMTQLEALAEYGKELERWQEKMRQFQSALAKLEGLLAGNLPMNFKMNMQERAEDYGVQESCPNPKSGGGFSPAALFSAVLPDMGGDVLKEQQRVCANIVTLENMKYNELVKMINDAKKRQDEIKALTDRASGGDENTQQSAMVASQNLIAQTLTELQYSQARVNAYSGMVESLKLDQKRLGNRALNGDPSKSSVILGTLISTGVLAGALEIAD